MMHLIEKIYRGKEPASQHSLVEFLDRMASKFNDQSFIADDPISIPHRFSGKQDIEIAGFFAAIFSWGNRTTIIHKSRELMKRMDDAPFDFVINHTEKDLKKLLDFKHRTFQATDLLYFIEFLRIHYQSYSTGESMNEDPVEPSLELAFTQCMKTGDEDITNGLIGFYHYFFSLEHVPSRTMKHIASPEKNSTCKRLNMFLRWMVRKDHAGVDFGIWKRISPSQLICPVDLHVARVAKRLGLITRKQSDWLAALELTEHLRRFDPADPVKYDFALFGLGMNERESFQKTSRPFHIIPPEASLHG